MFLSLRVPCGSFRVGTKARNQQKTIGAAMSLAKKCDIRDRLSAGRSRSQHSFRPVIQAERADSSAIEQDGLRPNRLSFTEDFMLEHTRSGLRVAMMGKSGNSGTGSREQHKSAQCFGFPS